MLDVERLPQAMHRALADIAFDLDDIISRDALFGERNGAIDKGLRHGSAGIGFEDNIVDHPTLAEIFQQQIESRFARGRESMEETMRAFKHGARSQKSAARHQCCAQTRLRRPARMHALGPGAFCQIFDNAGGHRTGNAERIHRLLLV